MLIGPKRTLFMDEISTGLDASTTQQIVQCIRNLVHLQDVRHLCRSFYLLVVTIKRL